MTYVGVTPGWIVRDDQGRIISVIERPVGIYRVHAVEQLRHLGNRVGEAQALDLAGAKRRREP